jgi:hypothetical protein
MTKNARVAVLVALVILAVSVAGVIRRHGEVPPAINLVGELGGAETRPRGAVFPVKDVTIDGESRRSIVVRTSTRIIWRVVLPAAGARRALPPGVSAWGGWWDAMIRGRAPEGVWLRTRMALDPEVWTREGDGMLFRVGIREVSPEGPYKEIFQQYLNPYGVPGDRRWAAVSLDLSAEAGQQVEIIFNTNASLPGKSDERNDVGVWGAPGVYLRP